MSPDERFREVASWRLASELKRRHPSAFTLIIAHPGGGTYNGLSFVRNADGTSANEHLACLNRGGSFVVFETSYTRDGHIGSQELWTPARIEGSRPIRLLNEMSALLGRTVSKKLPPMTPETLTYLDLHRE